MPYDEDLAGRIRKLLEGREGIREQKMFGGIAFMAPGGMFCGITRDDFMGRLPPAAYDEALGRLGARPMFMGDRLMKGMIAVSPEGYSGDKLNAWVDECYSYIAALPAKPPPKPPTGKRAAS
ncbi:MAG TPA: TfoX/Sxy family protein [Dehalococcoidia bacterium]